MSRHDPDLPIPADLLAPARRILVVRMDGLGDLLLTVPMLRGLRSSAPAARITLLVDAANIDFAGACPFVDEVLSYGIRRGGAGRAVIVARHLTALSMLAARLRIRRFDLAISPRWGPDVRHAALAVRLSGAGRRVAYAQPPGAEAERVDRRFTHLVPRLAADPPPRHDVLRNLDFLTQLGGSWQSDALESWQTDDDRAAAERFLAAAGVAQGERLVALCPNAAGRKRLWPIERFSEVGRWIIQRYGARLIVFGGPGEEPAGAELARRIGDPATIDAIGRLTIRGSSSVLRRCSLYLGNDTGVMHLAAAIGVPCVEISCHPQPGDPNHPNSPARFHPWGVPYRVAQPREPTPPCTGHCNADAPHCILNVSVDQVTSLTADLLSQVGASRLSAR